MQVSDVPGRRDSFAPISHRCPVCGTMARVSQQFCGSCGAKMPTSPTPIPPKPALVPSSAVAEPPRTVRAPKKALVGWVVAALAFAAGLGVFLVEHSALSEEKTSNRRLAARVAAVESKNSKLNEKIESATEESTALRGENDTLETAVTDCRDAAVQMQKVITSLYALGNGRITLADWRSKVRTARTAMGVCRSEAQSSGIF